MSTDSTSTTAAAGPVLSEGLGVNAPRSPGTRLTVVIRDDGPMIHCGDSPSYRSVTVMLTPEQEAALSLRWSGSHGHEAVSRCFIDA